MWTLYDADQRVSAIRPWLLEHYKPTRLEAIDAEIPGYSEHVIRSHEQRFLATGSTVISRHESRSGRAEWFPPRVSCLAESRPGRNTGVYQNGKYTVELL